MNSGYKHLLLIAIVALVPGIHLSAQDTTMAATKLQAAYYKDQNGLERVVARLLLKADRYEPYPNAEVLFYAVADTSNVLLSKMNTDAKGEAIYELDEKAKAFRDSTGQLAFVVEYAGSATDEASDKDIAVKAADLKVSFFQEDTTKFISVDATEPGGDNTPIAGIEIGLYIKGTFSHFNIAKDVTGADGKLIFPFPVEMPGDTSGVLTIVAKIEDNDVYGNVESWGNINWGRPVPLAVEARRGLGDTDAPLWMVYTLIVLLSAVWFHYAYVIFLVIKIKLAKHHA